LVLPLRVFSFNACHQMACLLPSFVGTLSLHPVYNERSGWWSFGIYKICIQCLWPFLLLHCVRWLGWCWISPGDLMVVQFWFLSFLLRMVSLVLCSFWRSAWHVYKHSKFKYGKKCQQIIFFLSYHVFLCMVWHIYSNRFCNARNPTKLASSWRYDNLQKPTMNKRLKGGELVALWKKYKKSWRLSFLNQ
jgi:hypothetical protein